MKDLFGINLEDGVPLRWAWPLCQQCAVTGLFGPAGRGGHSTGVVQTSLSSDSRDLATGGKHTQSGDLMCHDEAQVSYFRTWKHRPVGTLLKTGGIMSGRS